MKALFTFLAIICVTATSFAKDGESLLFKNFELGSSISNYRALVNFEQAIMTRIRKTETLNNLYLSQNLKVIISEISEGVCDNSGPTLIGVLNVNRSQKVDANNFEAIQTYGVNIAIPDRNSGITTELQLQDVDACTKE